VIVEDARTLFANLTQPSPGNLTARDLHTFFNALHGLHVPSPVVRSPAIAPDPSSLRAFLDAIRGPISRKMMRGGLLNPWQIAGLKRNEVRIAATLAGLWDLRAGGTMSQDFLAAYLATALPEICWAEELARGYRVETEVNPMGDLIDRVDLVIETQAHLVGIEVKIDASFGPRQLERYADVLAQRGRNMRRTAHLVLLAGVPSPKADVPATDWRDVAAAARSVSGGDPFAQALIHRFGDYVAHL